MNDDALAASRLAETLEALQAEVARLSARLDELEGSGNGKGGSGPVPNELPKGLDEGTLLAISAAIAAFLGKRGHIRQIRLLGSPAWAQQGRVTIQASHDLAVHHG
jgi:methylmalonyl-CoA carboxyltransferase large subunit